MIYISLGSNLGHKEENLLRARQEISRYLLNVKGSSLIETESFYNHAEPSYINQVITGVFPNFLRGSVTQFLKYTQYIQKIMGRIPTKTRNLPRIIDIDILAHNQTIIHTGDLILPHPRMHQRLFVLEPLHEVAPSWRHPVLQKTALELLICLKISKIR